MFRKAHLRNVAFEAALALGLGAPAWAQAPFQTPLFGHEPKVEAPLPPNMASLFSLLASPREKTFTALVTPRPAVKGDFEAKAQVTDFWKLAFGQWPVPGVEFDPDIVREVPLELTTRFDRSPSGYHATTNGYAGFGTESRDMARQDYLEDEGEIFGPAKIRSALPPFSKAWRSASRWRGMKRPTPFLTSGWRSSIFSPARPGGRRGSWPLPFPATARFWKACWKRERRPWKR